MSGPLYLVTGGAGFIGSHLAERLIREDCRVRVLDDLSTGSAGNLEDLPVELHQADLRDPQAVAQLAEGCRGIFHLGAIPSVTRSVENPRDSHDANVTGTLNVLEAARRRSIKVVFAGSSSAYGDTPSLPKHEGMRESPQSPYAAAKLAGELYMRVYARVYELPTVTLRFFNVYGPRQRPDSPYSGVVARFARAFLRNETPRIDGDGEQSRDFTFVEDTVDGVLRAMQRDVPPGSLYNIATGVRVSVKELAWLLQELTGSRAEPEHGPPRPGDVRHSLADIARAETDLGYRPRTSLRDGLRKTVDWYVGTMA